MMWQDIEEASGLCDSVLRYMAKGRRDAGVTKYIALAPALGVSLAYLLTGKNRENLKRQSLRKPFKMSPKSSWMRAIPATRSWCGGS